MVFASVILQLYLLRSQGVATLHGQIRVILAVEPPTRNRKNMTMD